MYLVNIPNRARFTSALGIVFVPHEVITHTNADSTELCVKTYPQKPNFTQTGIQIEHISIQIDLPLINPTDHEL